MKSLTNVEWDLFQAELMLNPIRPELNSGSEVRQVHVKERPKIPLRVIQCCITATTELLRVTGVPGVPAVAGVVWV